MFSSALIYSVQQPSRPKGLQQRLLHTWILDAMHSSESRELTDRLQVRAAGILVAEVRTEEVPHPLLRLWLGGKDRGQGKWAEWKRSAP